MGAPTLSNAWRKAIGNASAGSKGTAPRAKCGQMTTGAFNAFASERGLVPLYKTCVVFRRNLSFAINGSAENSSLKEKKSGIEMENFLRRAA